MALTGYPTTMPTSPAPVRGAPLRCGTCLVTCIDFRLHDPVHSFIQSEGLAEDGVDVIRVAGAARNLVAPAKDSDREFVLRQIGLALQLHDCKLIYLVNHEDCGAYGPENFPDEDAERETHHAHLAEAVALLRERFPKIEIRTHLLPFG